MDFCRGLQLSPKSEPRTRQKWNFPLLILQNLDLQPQQLQDGMIPKRLHLQGQKGGGYLCIVGLVWTYIGGLVWWTGIHVRRQTLDYGV